MENNIVITYILQSQKRRSRINAAAAATTEKDHAKAQPTQIRFRTSFANTIFDVMKSRGWLQTDSEHDWDIHWAESNIFIVSMVDIFLICSSTMSHNVLNLFRGLGV